MSKMIPPMPWWSPCGIINHSTMVVCILEKEYRPGQRLKPSVLWGFHCYLDGRELRRLHPFMQFALVPPTSTKGAAVIL